MASEKRKEHGVSFTEVMMISAVLAACAIAAREVVSRAVRSTKAMNSTSSIDTVSTNIENVVVNPILLSNTLKNSGNTALLSCAQNLAGCNVATATPITLIHPSHPLRVLAGPVTDPVFYGTDGMPCKGSNCRSTLFPLEAIAAFTLDSPENIIKLMSGMSGTYV